MRRAPRALVSAAAALVLAAPAWPSSPFGPAPAALHAQASPNPTLDGKEPRRPKLDAGADTNDSRAYVAWAHRRDTPAKKAFDAFWWAFRLEPDAQFLRLNMLESVMNAQTYDWRREYWGGAGFVVKSKEARLLDSLANLVYYREPFATLYARTCYMNRDVLEYFEKEPYFIADYYQSQGCFKQAAETWPKYLATAPGDLTARLNLVRVYQWTRQHGNALRELEVALDTLRARDQTRTYRFYVSKAQLETMRGEILEDTEDYFNARKAFGRALEEDLSYWPAHVRLARLALRENDAPVAVRELEQAVELASYEPAVHAALGDALLRAGRIADAEQAYRRALALEPHYALAQLNLAIALDRQEKKDEAISQYRAYLARAPKRHAQPIARAQQRLAALGSLATEVAR